MIGVFDSGVGGLSVLPHLVAELPYEDLIYVADQGHVPYGRRSQVEIQAFSAGISQFLLDQGAKLVVVACNTASAAALSYLREQFPTVPFVGMEPAIKPGAAHTRTGKVGVLATVGTFQSERYASLTLRFTKGVEMWEDPCLGLVELIEAGLHDSPEVEQLLANILKPMIDAGIDTLVLGCTHYPFVLPIIHRLVGESIMVIDPAPAVARQTKRVLAEHHWLEEIKRDRMIVAYTTGNAGNLANLTQQLLHLSLPTYALKWWRAEDHWSIISDLS